MKVKKKELHFVDYEGGLIVVKSRDMPKQAKTNRVIDRSPVPALL
jgi:hypothetical protein